MTDRNRPSVDVIAKALADTAEAVHAALYGRPSDEPAAAAPLAQADEAKRRRDIVGELDALMSGSRSLEEQPWYPARPGDLVHIAYEATSLQPAFGETYAVEEDPDYAGDMRLRSIHHNYEGEFADGMIGCFAPAIGDDPLMEVWMEAGPQRLTVVRDGVVVHPSRPGPAVPSSTAGPRRRVMTAAELRKVFGDAADGWADLGVTATADSNQARIWHGGTLVGVAQESTEPRFRGQLVYSAVILVGDDGEPRWPVPFPVGFVPPDPIRARNGEQARWLPGMPGQGPRDTDG